MSISDNATEDHAMTYSVRVKYAQVSNRSSQSFHIYCTQKRFLLDRPAVVYWIKLLLPQEHQRESNPRSAGTLLVDGNSLSPNSVSPNSSPPLQVSGSWLPVQPPSALKWAPVTMRYLFYYLYTSSVLEKTIFPRLHIVSLGYFNTNNGFENFRWS